MSTSSEAGLWPTCKEKACFSCCHQKRENVKAKKSFRIKRLSIDSLIENEVFEK